jgi:hypothetical protein
LAGDWHEGCDEHLSEYVNILRPFRKEGREMDKENGMKLFKLALLIIAVAVMAPAQTVKMGMGAFSSESGAILMAIDAGLVNRIVDSPYVMFVGYFGAKDTNKALTIEAKDVVMVYKGREYAMPSVKELRGNYVGGQRDIQAYTRLGKEGVNASWVRIYEFPNSANFFPPNAPGAELAVDAGHLAGYLGFLTPLYFKNPGLAKGDTLVIKVRDKKNPELVGECEVTLD